MAKTLQSCTSWRDWGSAGEFWARLTWGKRRILFLDYDGTLAPFSVDRDQARPYPQVPELLQRLQAQTRLILVSGREAQVVGRLLAIDPWPEIWGCHGGERLLPGKGLQPVRPGPKQSRGLELAASQAKARGLEASLEYKPGCLALHWRGKDAALPQARNLVQDNWQDLASGHGLVLRPFDGGVELRLAGLNKARAVKTVLQEAANEPVAAYLGDDLTDEDAFAALEGQGLSVLVRQDWRPTRAQLWLSPPQELLEFLKRWQQVTQTGSQDHGPKTAEPDG